MLLSKVAQETFTSAIAEKSRSAEGFKESIKAVVDANEVPTTPFLYGAAKEAASQKSLMSILKFIEKNRISGISTNNVKKIISEVGENTIQIPKRGGVGLRSPTYLIATSWYTKRVYLNNLVPSGYRGINIDHSIKTLGATKPDSLIRTLTLLDGRTLRWLNLVGKKTFNLPSVNVSFGVVPRFSYVSDEAKARYDKCIARIVSSTYSSDNVCYIPAHLANEEVIVPVVKEVFSTMCDIIVKALNAKANTTNTWYSFSSFVNQYISEELARINTQITDTRRIIFSNISTAEAKKANLLTHTIASTKYSVLTGMNHMLSLLAASESQKDNAKSLEKFFPMLRVILQSPKADAAKQADVNALIADFSRENLVIALLHQEVAWDAMIDMSCLYYQSTAGNQQLSMASKMNEIAVLETYAKAMKAEDIYGEAIQSVYKTGMLGIPERAALFKEMTGIDVDKMLDPDGNETATIRPLLKGSDFNGVDYPSFFPSIVVSPEYVEKSISSVYNITRSLVRLGVDYMLLVEYPPIQKSANNG